jgi:hypothetical protein
LILGLCGIRTISQNFLALKPTFTIGVTTVQSDDSNLARFEPTTFNYESMSRAWFKRLVKSERPNFSSGTEVRITIAERYRRLIV